MFFIGIDLAWSEKNPTGLATIKGDKDGGELISSDLVESDEEIVDYVQEKVGNKDALITIDAPLLVPNEEGRRVAEELVGKLFRKYDAGAHPTNRKRLTQWTGRVRGEDLVEKLEEVGFEHDPDIEKFENCKKVIEIYPHPSMVVLFRLDNILRYKNKPGRDYDFLWDEFREYQSHLKDLEKEDPSLSLPPEITEKEVEGLRGGKLKEYEDRMDAVFSAYIAYYYWKNPGKCAVLGNMDEGYIMTPLKDDMWGKLEDIRSQRSLGSFTAVEKRE